MATKTTRPIMNTADLPGSVEFQEHLQEYLVLKETIDALENQQSVHKDRLKFFLEAWRMELAGEVEESTGFDTDLGGKRFRAGLYQNAPRKEIKAELLLKQGVTMQQIEAATVTGEPSKPYVKVQEVKGSND